MIVAWCMFYYAMMYFYGCLCLFAPDVALKHFSGEKSVSSVTAVQMTKRLGIVYSIAAMYGFFLLWIAGNVSGMLWIYSTSCLMGAGYSAALCVLISFNQTFWDNNGVRKNAPFILINILFYIWG